MTVILRLILGPARLPQDQQEQSVSHQSIIVTVPKQLQQHGSRERLQAKERSEAGHLARFRGTHVSPRTILGSIAGCSMFARTFQGSLMSLSSCQQNV